MICLGLALRGVFPPEVRTQATALACSLLQEQGVPLARWSHASIAQQLVALKLVTYIAASTVGRWLKADKLKPWCFRLWQHILDPHSFLERARPILDLYMHAQQLLQAGIWIVCVDEKTSIQAREGEQPPRAARPGQIPQRCPRYIRHGALQLFAGLSVAESVVFGHCRERKCFADFQAFLREVILPEAVRRKVSTLALILDNGPTHAPKQLEPWLYQEVAAQGLSLSVQVYWLPTRASWLDQIEIWLSILQRQLLKPNHFVSVTSLEQAISAFMTYYNQTAQPLKWSYTSEKLAQKLAPKLGTHL